MPSLSQLKITDLESMAGLTSEHENLGIFLHILFSIFSFLMRFLYDFEIIKKYMVAIIEFDKVVHLSLF